MKSQFPLSLWRKARPRQSGKRAFLHIGGRKTGSTTLQAIMKGNRGALLKHGIVLPETSRPNPSNPEDFTISRFFRGRPEYQEAVTAQSERFRTISPQAASKVVISSEALTDLTHEQLKRFRDWLGEIFDAVTVIFYVRRQDIAGTSYYSTALRHGSTSALPLSENMGPRGRWPFCYGSIVHQWKEIFPNAEFNVRRFVERAEDAGWSVTDDFFGQLDVPVGALDIRQLHHNVSSSSEALGYILAVNRLAEQGRLPSDRSFRIRLVNRINAQFPSAERLRPSRDRAFEFYRSFAEENAQLRSLCFPDRDRMFDENFDLYPEQEQNILDVVDPPTLERLIMEEVNNSAPTFVDANQRGFLG